MQIKSYNHQSITEWSNSKNYSQLLACAQINPDKNNLYNLEILSLDLSDRSKNLNTIGNAFYNVPFRCLAWDTYGQKQNIYPNGIIFGGMQDGSYTLWNAYEMINNYNKNNIVKNQQSIQSQPSFLYGEQAQQDSYPIMCAQWNTLKNNFLAFGSTDLLILDIGKDISNPQIKKPGHRNPHEGSYITSVSWNKQVANILASASQNGLIALWDIKANKSIFQFKDSPSTNSTNRNVVICWNKNISTQLAVTLDDQKRNQLQIWDLRNQKGPVAVFERGHMKGINTMQWSETDPELILTGGRDNKIVCWNYTQEEGPVSTYQLNNQIYDVKWSKKLKSIYSVSLQDKMQIFTLDESNLFNYVPKWYKVPVGSTIFGNESILTYSQNEGNKLTQTKINSIITQQNSKITELLKQLQIVLDQTQPQPDNSQNQFWSLINAKNSNQGDDAIYDYLGYNKQKIIKQVQKYTGKKRQSLHVKAETQVKNKLKPKAYTPVIGQQAASFFASIGENNTKSTGLMIQEQQDNQNVKYDMVPRNFNWNTGKQRIIKHNILIGNYQGAIDAAIKCGRTAQALIMAYSVDQNTFNSTLKTFFTQTTDNFITDILKNITYRDNEQLVRKYNLDNWKQCIALIYSISSSDKRRNLLNLLASRIRQQNLKQSRRNNKEIVPENNPAIQCYVLSENFNQIANLYYDNLQMFENRSYQRKQVVVEYAKRLILIHQSLVTDVQLSKNFHKIIRQAAFVATQQNYKMVSYLIFTKYLYQTSMRQIDMIIHATKNLQEYKNSIVFPLVNIPIMQFKEQQTQKGKKPNSMDNQHQHHNQHQKGPAKNINVPVPPQHHQHTTPQQQQNVNVVPTKDKNGPPRPPIFNKKEQIKQPAKNIPMPPPVLPNKTKNQVYEQQDQPVEQQRNINNMNKNKKVPPPPNFKGHNRQQQQSHHNQVPTYIPPPPSHQQHNNPHNNSLQNQSNKKVQQPSIPPPPMKNKPNQQNYKNTRQYDQEQYQHQHQQSSGKKLPPPIKSNNTNTGNNNNNNNNRVPPPPPNRNKQQQQNQYEQQQQHHHQNHQQNQRNPPVNNSNNSNQNLLGTKTMRGPPPPGRKNIPTRPSHQQYEDQQPQHQPQQQQVSSKKSIPPPNIKRQYHEQQQQQSTSYNPRGPYQQQQSNNQAKVPPPPMNKSNQNKFPPPPLMKQSSSNNYQQEYQQNNQHQHQQQQQQYNNSNQHQQHQQYQQYNSNQQQQYETPVIKRPPPPVSGKKGPPPPPPRR